MAVKRLAPVGSPARIGECADGDTVVIVHEGRERAVMLMQRYFGGGWAVAPAETALWGNRAEYFHLGDDHPVERRIPRVVSCADDGAVETDPLLTTCAGGK